MKKAILYMSIGSALTMATLVALEGKYDMDRCLKKMNRQTMRTYRYIKGKMHD